MYEKTTWANGDIITAEKLNHMEDGIGCDIFVVNSVFSNGDIILDKTFSEINQLVSSGKIGFILSDEDGAYTIVFISSVDGMQNNGKYVVGVSATSITVANNVYKADTENDYPVLQ